MLRDVIVFPFKAVEELNELPAEVVREFQDETQYSTNNRISKKEWHKRLEEIKESQGRHKNWVQPVTKVVDYI